MMPHADDSQGERSGEELDAMHWQETRNAHQKRALHGQKQEPKGTPPIDRRELRYYADLRFEREAMRKEYVKPEEIEFTDEVEKGRYRELGAFRLKSYSEAVREYRKLQREITQYRAFLNFIADDLRNNLITPAQATMERQKYLTALENTRQALIDLTSRSPESFYFVHRLELSQYVSQLHAGRIVETPWIQEQLDGIERSLRAGEVVFLHGPTGTGKTEGAKHLARTRFGREAIVLRGHSRIMPEELWGHTKLSASETIAPDKINDEINRLMNGYKKDHPLADGAELGEVARQIEQALIARTGTLQSEFELGPVYEAIRTGRILIIDEANYIPAPLMASLNAIMGLRPGEFVDVQQDGHPPIMVAEGFGIVLTGNINLGEVNRYRDRFELDEALRNRVVSKEWGLLSQEVEGTREQGRGGDSELYILLWMHLLDRRESTLVPRDTPDKLWRLAQAGALIQRLSEGAITDARYLFQQSGQPLKTAIKQTAISIRTFERILNSWKADGYREEIDGYVYKYIVDQVTNSLERAYLYQLLSTHFDFFKHGSGWPEKVNYGGGGQVPYLRVNVPKNSAPPLEFFTAPTVIEVLYGDFPARTKWPSTQNEAGRQQTEGQAKIAELMELKLLLSGEQNKYSEAEEDLLTCCPISEPQAGVHA
ncbi:hypothetical protein HYW32_02145 [Candidatus Berkelbacteria bacterium]|nr:hypothetical protein [Candidatus Berkelbacteria bacterium]